MEIILLLLGDKRGDSEQHGCFSLVLFTSPSSYHPTNPSWSRWRTNFIHSNSLSLSHLYIKKNRTHHHDASDTYIILKNNLNHFPFKNNL